MKNNLQNRIGLTVLAVLFALFGAFPDAAQAVQIELTGKVIPLTSGEPVEKYWETGDMIMHARTEYQRYYFDTSDPRLTGWGFGNVDWEFNWYPDGSLRHGHIWGPITITADEQGLDGIWKCTANAKLDSEWNFELDAVCHGVGVNKGLQAKFKLSSLTCDASGCYYPVTGRIIDTTSK
jgi:hypothetical protein